MKENQTKKKHSIICSGILRIHQHKCQNNETFVWSWLICSFCGRFLKALDLAARGLRIYWQKNTFGLSLYLRGRDLLLPNIWIPFALTRGLSLPISRTSMKKHEKVVVQDTPTRGSDEALGSRTSTRRVDVAPRHHCEWAKDRRVLVRWGA